MGSRGSFSSTLGHTGGIPLDKQEYSCIGILDHIKIIQSDKKSNNPTTTYSNTANTTYFSYSKEKGRIEHIYYFKNHKLYKSVDFKLGETPHAHYWNNGAQVGRKKHNAKNILPLSPKDHRLHKAATEYNKSHGKKNN